MKIIETSKGGETVYAKASLSELRLLENIFEPTSDEENYFTVSIGELRKLLSDTSGNKRVAIGMLNELGGYCDEDCIVFDYIAPPVLAVCKNGHVWDTYERIYCPECQGDEPPWRGPRVKSERDIRSSEVGYADVFSKWNRFSPTTIGDNLFRHYTV